MEKTYLNFLETVALNLHVKELLDLLTTLHPRDIVKLIDSSTELRELFDKDDDFCLGLFKKYFPDAYLPLGHEFGILKELSNGLQIVYAIHTKLTRNLNPGEWITMPEIADEAHRTNFISVAECPPYYTMIDITDSDTKNLLENDVEQYVVFVTEHIGGSIRALRASNLQDAMKLQKGVVADKVAVTKNLSREVAVIHTQDTCLITDIEAGTTQHILLYSVLIKKIMFKADVLRCF